MRGPAVLLHVLGVALWLGGGFASMVSAIASKHEAPSIRAGTARLLATIHQRIISPGVILTLVTGFYLMMQLGPGAMERPAIAGMAVAGLLAGLVSLLIGLPTANMRARAAQLDQSGQLPPIVERLSKRQAVVMTIGGVLAVIALACAYLG